MKKLVLGVVMASLTLGMGSVTTFAAYRNCQANYVDADGDGICDNRGKNTCGNYADEDGDGICDSCGKSTCGQNYVDADGDGVCDNKGTNNAGSQSNRRGGCGFGNRCGRR